MKLASFTRVSLVSETQMKVASFTRVSLVSETQMKVASFTRVSLAHVKIVDTEEHWEIRRRQ